MAQYDLLLTQNTHATSTEFTERYVNFNKGGLLSVDASRVPGILAGGTLGQYLKADPSATYGMVWTDFPSLSQLHDQNTDTGTTSGTFALASGGYNTKIKAESATKVGLRNAADNAYLDFQAKDATFNSVTLTTGTITTAPSSGNDIVNKTYADSLIGANDAMVYKGAIDCAANPNYPAASAGWTYKISVAGRIGGAAGVIVKAGDMAICTADNTATGDQATVGTYWNVVERNLDGAVIGPSSAVNDNIAVFDGTSGVLIKDGGAKLSDYITKATLTAYTMLYADTNATPAAVILPAGSIPGRKASGGIVAIDVDTELAPMIWRTDTAPTAKNSTGIAGQFYNDGNFLYICTATNTWKRSPLATNW